MERAETSPRSTILPLETSSSPRYEVPAAPCACPEVVSLSAPLRSQGNNQGARSLKVSRIFQLSSSSINVTRLEARRLGFMPGDLK
eukprot:553491-Hanusia_phi.AAC.1